MKNKYHIAHEIPNRIRIIIPALAGRKDYKYIINLFSAVKGIENVRLEPVINSIAIEYDGKVIDRNIILRYIAVSFYQATYSPIDNLLAHVKPKVRQSLFYSLVTGALLLISLARKKTNRSPDMLDYVVMISSAYTVLTHGGKDKLTHPDIIAGIVSMLSLGPNNIIQAAAISWGVNLLEVLFDMTRNNSCKTDML
jgi:hypothetical protein